MNKNGYYCTFLSAQKTANVFGNKKHISNIYQQLIIVAIYALSLDNIFSHWCMPLLTMWWAFTYLIDISWPSKFLWCLDLCVVKAFFSTQTKIYQLYFLYLMIPLDMHCQWASWPESFLALSARDEHSFKMMWLYVFPYIVGVGGFFATYFASKCCFAIRVLCWTFFQQRVDVFVESVHITTRRIHKRQSSILWMIFISKYLMTFICCGSSVMFGHI